MPPIKKVEVDNTRYKIFKILGQDSEIKDIGCPIGFKNSNNYCKKCGIEISKSAKYCKKCSGIIRSKKPAREELKKMIRTKTFTKCCDIYNICTKTLENWCKSEQLPYRKKDINALSDEEWSKV